jgi:hypothetical protein
MNLDKAVMGFAGLMVLLSVALTWFHSQYWLLLTTFIGLNLLQTSFTGFCPAAILFSRLGIKSGSVFPMTDARRGSALE